MFYKVNPVLFYDLDDTLVIRVSLQVWSLALAFRSFCDSQGKVGPVNEPHEITTILDSQKPF